MSGSLFLLSGVETHIRTAWTSFILVKSVDASSFPVFVSSEMAPEEMCLIKDLPTLIESTLV
jgi:hypothetical protein